MSTSCRKGHDLSVLGRNKWGQCIACKRVSNARFNASPRGKAKKARYRASPKGKLTFSAERARYRASPNGKAVRKAAEERYNASARGQIANMKRELRYRIKGKLNRIAMLEEQLNASS